jgi:hypothetical protein
MPRYTLESVTDWVAFKHGIGIPEWSSGFVSPSTTTVYKYDMGIPDVSSDSVMPSTSRDMPNDVTWEDIEIRIRKDNKIAYSHEKGKWKEKTFADIGLLDMRKQQPNHHAGILLGLSKGKKFPPSSVAEGKHKTAICRLGKLLRKLTGIEDDPFTKFNKTHGWKPRFKLTDDRKNADERAKKAVIHTVYDDEKSYDDEDDEGGKFIRESR